MKRFKSHIFAVSISLAWPIHFHFSSAQAQSYTVVDLGTPVGYSNSFGAYSAAHGINNSGSVVGEWSPDANSQRAFLYANGANRDLGILPATFYAIAHAINASNLVVGEGNSYTDTRAFLYTNGVMADLTTPSPAGGFTYSIAHAISNSGEIVGESYSSEVSGDIHAVIFLGNRQETDLGTLTNGTYSSAYGINSSNVIVGESTTSSGNTYAFIYSNNTMTSVGALPGGNYSAAFAINDSGRIAGEAADSNSETHAFVFSGGAMIDLGTLGGTNSSATAINNAGQVVGYALTAAGDQHAFLYQGTNLLDLNNLISPSSVCSNLISADGINDAGQITGSGYTPNGDYHAFLLTPALALTAPTILPNGQFRITVSGVPGNRFVLESSADFVNWTKLSTNTLTTNTLDCTDPSAALHPCTFYRALLLP